MRGAAVPAGEHRLVYQYDPWSFRIGATISILAMLALVILIARSFGRSGGGEAEGLPASPGHALNDCGRP
jgi:hypothetical protein